ncbi:unnamed protein product [Trichobilharzia regenti]|nr:unnamed protein product [Trichobilharzia regenti]
MGVRKEIIFFLRFQLNSSYIAVIDVCAEVFDLGIDPRNHGGLTGSPRHPGDLGNLQVDNKGVMHFDLMVDISALHLYDGFLGRAIVIHAKEDNLGLKKSYESHATGNSGRPLTCALIGSPRHPGDLGNLQVDDKGVMHFDLKVDISALYRYDGFLGRAIVIHENEDDLGLKNNEGSHATGNSGRRLTCAVIGIWKA